MYKPVLRGTGSHEAPHVCQQSEKGNKWCIVGVSVHINAMERVHSRENSHSNPFKLIRRHFA